MPNKIYVVCPGGVTTGGPEVLHQLISELRDVGRDAFICYYPFNRKFEIPPEYRKYNIAQSVIEDECENLVILPESGTKISRKIRHANVAIWWLSIDNYYMLPKSLSFLSGSLQQILGALLVRRSLRSLRPYRHFAQSHYAIEYLRQRGVEADFLGDYLSEDHMALSDKAEKERYANTIVYNPKKGAQTTSELVAQCPEWKFIPIAGMTASEVNALLASAMLYIDFGHHPGRDRLPREAALAGCCVITGKKGAAGNDVDINLPKEYKIDETAPNFIEKFRSAASAIFLNFSAESAKFENYRHSISVEKSKFRSAVAKLFV